MLLSQRTVSMNRTRTRNSIQSTPHTDLRFRRATAADLPTIRTLLFQEKMNPLSLDPAKFTVVENSKDGVVAFAQLEQQQATAGKPVYEFRSLVVAPQHRGQGIGRGLLQKMIGDCPHNDIYLTTISCRIPFYEREGFRLLQLREIPRFLWFEAAAGTVVARLAVNDQLVVMQRPSQGN